MRCWGCQSEVGRDDYFCPTCRRIQPADPEADHFAALGLPRAYDLDPQLLEERHLAATRLLHPDRFARADPREQALSLERTARVNDAHRTLCHQRSRAEYLLTLLGHGTAAAGGPGSDPEFVEQQLAVRERLALARASGDPAALAAIATDARSRLVALEEEVARLFAEGEPGEGSLLAIGRCLSRASYFEAVAADAERGVEPSR